MHAQENKPAAPAAPAKPAAASPVTNVTVDQAEKTLKERKDVVVLDVRSQSEYNDGHLKGSLLFPVADVNFADLLKKLDKSKTYLVHCQSGRRSSDAVNQMWMAGFKSILHMNEGFGAWEKAKKEVDKTPAP